jgi:hypothetical protein
MKDKFRASLLCTTLPLIFLKETCLASTFLPKQAVKFVHIVCHETQIRKSGEHSWPADLYSIYKSTIPVAASSPTVLEMFLTVENPLLLRRLTCSEISFPTCTKPLQFTGG